ncbi:hypothetical protein C3B44_10185 [Corynebacterium yudongzhengii]|uniref:Uncharacterized protein n=1 Tax=Corynebacterium yudongzhengii TaxID=2080740 RepID=A0A2U1T5U8_9CORY|nr:hypothetical protein [Corynebacterium yudongzhengii]AWB82657.1 hypothetical protein C3B44_10185 [Corynebacterium yudongzhengii]PWC01377.1 hypothetical protein DF222_07575 [Corynebacterium yudongzhengii]
MDLATIQGHLDNFVTTWEGWTAVLQGIPQFLLSWAEADFQELFENTSSSVEALSSGSSNAGSDANQ